MYKYKVQVKKVSGRLNESVLPSKNLIVKSKTKKSNVQIFAEASEYYKQKYGIVLESADVIFEGFMDKVSDKVSSFVGRKFFGNKKKYQKSREEAANLWKEVWRDCDNEKNLIEKNAVAVYVANQKLQNYMEEVQNSGERIQLSNVRFAKCLFTTEDRVEYPMEQGEDARTGFWDVKFNWYGYRFDVYNFSDMVCQAHITTNSETNRTIKNSPPEVKDKMIEYKKRNMEHAIVKLADVKVSKFRYGVQVHIPIYTWATKRVIGTVTVNLTSDDFDLAARNSREGDVINKVKQILFEA